MSDPIDLITNSLEYTDKNNKKYEKLFSKFKKYRFVKNSSDIDHNKIIFYDKNEKEIFTSRYEIMGLYHNSSKSWTWAWSVPRYNKNQVYTSKKILNYGLNIPYEAHGSFLKSELITSRFKITNNLQIDIHSAIASYISKNPMIYKLTYSPAVTGEERKKMKDKKVQIYTIREDDDEFINNKEYVVNYLFLLDHDKIHTISG